MFNGETTELKLPCQYRLSDFTCGDYRVKVTPGSAVDKDYSHRFSPDTVWVNVVYAKTGAFLKIRTSVKRLDKLSKGKISNPWQVMEGSVSVVDFANYDQSKAAAVLSKDGVFSVEFSSAERSVVVTCSDDEFISKGLPEALCGAGTTTDAIKSATTTLFPGQEDMTDDAFVTYTTSFSTRITSFKGKSQLVAQTCPCLCEAEFPDLVLASNDNVVQRQVTTVYSKMSMSLRG
ncbi:hypothetical protein V1264_005844 [Littorina saxatilis]|uniref:Uncharacterized protein n=1 Tax=Littorina saxatilis TaxID=31220 RepID=A0AAN9B302_9CAEN